MRNGLKTRMIAKSAGQDYNAREMSVPLLARQVVWFSISVKSQQIAMNTQLILLMESSIG